MGVVSAEGSVSDVNNGVGDSSKLGVSEFNDKDLFGDRNGSMKNGKSEQQNGQGREEGKSKESKSLVYDSMLSTFDYFATNGALATAVRPLVEVSSGHGFEVGDMVWGKVKSHPWWPGHVYSEEFATPSVRRSKREGLLLVAFFGDSSYGWFDPSELIPFDSNFAEKSRQTSSRHFVKAVEEAIDEVSRRSGLGLSCLCRSKQNFRQTDVDGFFSVDVADYDPGAVYSIDAIRKARDCFQPRLALDFVRQLALEPRSSEHVGIDFIKDKATVMSYRKAVYEEFDETYAQAFGYQSVQPSLGSIQELPSGKTASKAPLSGRQVFADTSGTGKSPARPNRPKDHAKKDKYLFKRRDEPKDTKMHQKEKGNVTSFPQPARFEDPIAIAAGDYMLQKRDSGTHVQIGTTDTNDKESTLSEATGTGAASMEDTPIVLEFSNPGFPMITSKVESPSSSSFGEVAPGHIGHLTKVRSFDEKRIVPEMDDRKRVSVLVDDKSSSEANIFTQDDIPSSGPHKIASTQRVDGGPKKVKVSKRPVGELGSGKPVLPEKKKKRKKELLMSDGTHIHWKEGASLVEKVSANKSVQPAPKPPIEDPHRTDGKATTSSSSHSTGAQEMTGLGDSEVELPRVLSDLFSLACDPFHAVNRGRRVKVGQVFLRFRSLVFEKSSNMSSLTEDEANDTHSSKSPAIISATSGCENGARVPPVRPQVLSSGRPDDPTKGGRKRGPSDRLEEIAAKKKKVSEIRNLTKEKKVIKKIDEPAARGDAKQAVVMTSKKLGPESIKKTEQRAPEPTMLVMKFPSGGSLPSINELKARFARYGLMDHSATRIYWNTFTCRVVYRHKAHAQAAYKFVVGSSSLFGNTDVKCSLKEVGVVGSAESEAAAKLPKEDALTVAHQPAMEDRPSLLPGMSGLQLKSCLKKSGVEEAGANGGNGSRGMPRVKFMLGEDESQKNNMENKNGSFSSSHATMDINSKNFQTVVPQSSHPLPLLPPLPTSTGITSSTAQFARPPLSSMHYGMALAPQPHTLNYGSDIATPPLVLPPPLPQPPGNFVHDLHRPTTALPATTNIDIRQQMLSLLTKCNDVVTNVTGQLGYVPYHPL